MSAITTETAVKVTVLLLTQFSGNAPSVLWWAKYMYVEMSAASSLKIPGKTILFQKKFPPHNTNKEIRILRVAYFIRMNFLLLHSVDYTYLWRWITSWRSWSHPRISDTKPLASKVTSTRSSSSFLASLIHNSSVSSTKIAGIEKGGNRHSGSDWNNFVFLSVYFTLLNPVFSCACSILFY